MFRATEAEQEIEQQLRNEHELREVLEDHLRNQKGKLGLGFGLVAKVCDPKVCASGARDLTCFFERIKVRTEVKLISI